MNITKILKMSEKDLLLLNSEIMTELKNREVIRTRNNPIADYCEWLVAMKYKWKLENSSNQGFDAVDNAGRRVQIKCRTAINGKGSRQLGVIRSLDQNPFDYLIAIIFDEKIEVLNAYRISKTLIRKYARFSKHQNGHILILKGSILSDKNLVDITKKLR